jgi:hypothetical protein
VIARGASAEHKMTATTLSTTASSWSRRAIRFAEPLGMEVKIATFALGSITIREHGRAPRHRETDQVFTVNLVTASNR